MVHVELTPEPRLPGSTGAELIALIKLFMDELGLSLAEAKSYVDRCVFQEQRVVVPCPSAPVAERLVRRIAELPGPPRVSARAVDR